MRQTAAAALAAAAFGADAAASDDALATLPFLDGGTNRIFLDLAPEGSSRPLRLMLDTGAAYSVLTPLAARELGVKVRRIKSDPYRRKTILGRDLQFYVDTRSSDTGSATGFEYGLLGGNFLAEYVVELDFPGRRVRFLDRKKARLPERVAEGATDEAILPLRIVSNRPGMKIGINGVEQTVLIDTGAPASLTLSGEVARQSGVESAPAAGLRMSVVHGEVTTEVGEVERVSIGPFEFLGVPATVHPKGLYNLGFPGDSVMGYDLLAQFVIRIDYRSARIWLERVAEPKVTWLGEDWSIIRSTGAQLVPIEEGAAFEVGMVLAVSPAARLGLLPGDRLMTDDLRVATDWILDGLPMNVRRMIDGRSRDITLQPPGGGSSPEDG